MSIDRRSQSPNAGTAALIHARPLASLGASLSEALADVALWADFAARPDAEAGETINLQRASAVARARLEDIGDALESLDASAPRLALDPLPGASELLSEPPAELPPTLRGGAPGEDWRSYREDLARCLASPLEDLAAFAAARETLRLAIPATVRRLEAGEDPASVLAEPVRLAREVNGWINRAYEHGPSRLLALSVLAVEAGADALASDPPAEPEPLPAPPSPAPREPSPYVPSPYVRDLAAVLAHVSGLSPERVADLAAGLAAGGSLAAAPGGAR